MTTKLPKTAAGAIQAARKALGQDAEQGVDFEITNTGAGYAFEAIEKAAPKKARTKAAAAIAEAIIPKAPKAAKPSKERVAAAKGLADALAKKPAKPKAQKKPADGPPTTDAPKRRAKAPKASTGSSDAPKPAPKLDGVIALLVRPQGATVEEVTALTGWAPHVVRARVTSNVPKRGYAVTSSKNAEGDPQGVRVYRAVTTFGGEAL